MEKLYTRQGDGGYTSTLSQKSISKADILIELLGSLDELDAVLGIAKNYTYDDKLQNDIKSIQAKLIQVMSEVAGAKQSVTKECIETVEKMTDSYNVLFQGYGAKSDNLLCAHLTHARSVARRCERALVKTRQTGRLRPELAVWINRISDLLYAMSCYAKKADNSPKDVSYATDKMSLALAKEIAMAVEEYAKTMGVKTVIAIVDSGANLVLLEACDDSYIASRKIAYEKAYTSVSLKMPTTKVYEESKQGALDGLTSGGGICMLGGGDPLIVGGSIIGAIGVSGGTAQQDTMLSNFAAQYLIRRQDL